MLKLYLFLISGFFFAVNIFSQSYYLTINNGYGSGNYQEGDSVHIWSKTPMDAAVFTNWTGDGMEYLSFENEWHVVLVVPELTEVGSLEFTAHYDAIPANTTYGVDSFLLWGKDSSGIFLPIYKEVNYAIPPSPKAMVFLLHGTGGSGRSFFKRFERTNLVKDLLYDDFAVFALDANETTMGDINEDGYIRWNNFNSGNASAQNNIDLGNVNFTRDSIVQKFNLPASIPTFTLGMSNGAVFSDLCASALGYNASAHITARGNYATYRREDIVPVIWIMSENDHQEQANNDEAFANFEEMTINGGQEAEFHIFNRSPVFPQRFRRNLVHISLNQSQTIFDSLEAKNYLDDRNFLNSLDISLIPNSFFNQLGLTGAQRKGVIDQLGCVNADHILHSDYSKNIIRFFNQFPEEYSPLADKTPRPAASNINVYPNPTNGKFWVSGSNKPAKLVSIYDIQGKLKGVEVIDTNTQSMNIDHYPPGVYILHFRTSDGWMVKRIVLE